MPPQALAGFRIGILSLDTSHPLELGNVQHAESFAFPVTYAIARGVSVRELMQGNPSCLPPILAGIAELNRAGVSIIAGACGSFANFQHEAAQASQVPVFMSILLEVPTLLRALPPSKKLGIIFSSVATFTDRVRAQCGIEDASRIVAVGANEIPAFGAILRQEQTLDSPGLEQGLVELATRTAQDHPDIGAWLIQCSDLPPYAAAIQKATSLPVFDMAILIEHLHRASRRTNYQAT